MATAKEIMEKKLLAAKDTKVTAPEVAKVTAPVPAPIPTPTPAPAPAPKPTVPAEATAALKAPKVAWKPVERTASYVSRAPNTEIFMGDKTSFKFKGNYYTTSNSKEIFELDSLCRRQPNVFSKSA